VGQRGRGNGAYGSTAEGRDSRDRARGPASTANTEISTVHKDSLNIAVLKFAEQAGRQLEKFC
jgi:hypothetical protein